MIPWKVWIYWHLSLKINPVTYYINSLFFGSSRENARPMLICWGWSSV